MISLLYSITDSTTSMMFDKKAFTKLFFLTSCNAAACEIATRSKTCFDAMRRMGEIEKPTVTMMFAKRESAIKLFSLITSVLLQCDRATCSYM